MTAAFARLRSIKEVANCGGLSSNRFYDYQPSGVHLTGD
jgi:hypothetical protein